MIGDGPEYEKAQKTKHALQHAILEYLKQHSPTKWDLLHMEFDTNNTGIAHEALNDLIQWEYIVVNEEKNVSITQEGLGRLRVEKEF